MSKFHLDLFSGIGGFAIAAQACGYTTIGFCEREPYAQQILKERFGAVLADASTTRPPRSGCESQSSRTQQQPCNGDSKAPRLHDDIFTLNGADYAGVDLLTGGFPCQPFSVAGKRRGAEDDRAIWPEMLRVIREAQPTWIIGENVAGIVTMELDNILSDLEGIGYSAWPLIIPACAVDARHRRDRVWIVAHAGHLCGRGRAEPTREERAETSNSGAKLADSEGAGLERREQHGTQLESELGLGKGGSCPRRQLPGGWREVVFAAECDPEGDGLCPCGFDYSDGCSQPGPTQDGYEYTERDGVLYGRPEGQADNNSTGGQGEDVAHADSQRGRLRKANGEDASDARQSPCTGEGQGRRQLEPAICGMADGIPEGLDGGARFCQWPEEDPGTARVTTGMKHRAHRLKGLGNSIVPQVAEEIIRAITNLR